MESTLRERGYAVVNVDYPSRSDSVGRLAEAALGRALSDPALRDVSTVHVVTHSMGGILLRSYLARHEVPRLGRVVMLGPPNRGSEVVDRLGHWWLFRRLNGPAGSELGTGADSTPNRLGPVSFELGVLAGNRSINPLLSLLIPGPDDGKVSVERTRVDGMKEHRVVPVSHPFLMRDRRVIEATCRFLRTGTFDG